MLTYTGKVTKTFFEEEGYSIREFQSDDIVTFPDGTIGRTFSIKGNFLPEGDISLKIIGEFSPRPYEGRFGRVYTFVVNEVEEVRNTDKYSIIKYLCTIKGIGTCTANEIVDKFGERTYEVLDNNINLLQEEKIVGGKRFQIIANDYLERGAAKEVYTYLYKFSVNNNKIGEIYSEYKEKSLEMIKTHPHAFYLKGYISFAAAEKITKAESLDLLSEERIEACSREALYRAENAGNTFLPWGELLRSVLKILGITESREIIVKVAAKVRNTIKQMGYGTIANKELVTSGEPVFYLRETGEAEFETASSVIGLMSRPIKKKDYLNDIKNAQKELGVSLSEEQESAVNMVLNSTLSVVTGGPGTGKTTFQQVLFSVYKKYNQDKEITLGAPTGRAARRMTESSGLPAATLHSILGLTASDSGIIQRNTESLRPGLIVVDEVSMMDIFLSQKLFQAVPEGAQIVCVGDIYQLPSVGPGTVLKSLIESKIIPTVKFTKIFRQKEGSSIAENAKRINSGIKDLLYDETCFNFIDKETPEEIVSEVSRIYAKSVEEYGIDEVTVLTPYRRTTATGVNQLNPVLKELVNPAPNEQTKSNRIFGTNIYIGDRVMFTKNMGGLTNGDIGYVRSISFKDNIQTVTVDFGDRNEVLVGEELNHLVLAYCTTIHKSQGSEYDCCIIIIDKEHEVLLKRNLIYTAITRAKQKVYIVGSKKAFYKGIDLEDTNKRNSQLSDLIAKDRSSL